jgi:hypothetical protein
MESLWRCDYLGWYQVVRDNSQILVGYDERDVVAIVYDTRYKRIVDVVAHSVTIYALHCGSPQLYIVLLFVVQSLSHTIGEQEGYTDKYRGKYQHHDSTILQNLILQP